MNNDFSAAAIPHPSRCACYTFRHLDLFSGIGGFSLAAKWAYGTAHEVVGFCEIDKYCQKVLKKHWPNVPIFEDIRSLDGRQFRDVDLVSGGFPCQPFSYAGKRQGKGDDRFLWPEMLRVISEARPRWIVGENVVGILNLEIKSVLSDLERIGYNPQPVIIPACAVNAPHRRDRVWILAHDDQRSRSPEHGEQQTEWAEVVGAGAGDVADTQGERLQREWGTREQESEAHGATALSVWGSSIRDVWEAEPDLVRVADGIPRRVDRLRALGNTIVPQVAFEILMKIKAIDEGNQQWN